MRLDGKVALVTGAARGIGRAIAFALAEAGADLVLIDIASNIAGVPYDLGNRSQLQHTADECRRRGSAVLAFEADVRDTAKTGEAVQAALKRFGRIDVLVNNAGIAAPSGKIAHEIADTEWDLMIDVDLGGAWRMIKAVAPAMFQARGGSIINICSTAGVVGYRHFAAYVAAKHGLLGLTRAAALDYAPRRVRVNAVLPGSVRDDPVLEGVMLSQIARSLDVPVEQHEAFFVTSQPTNALIEAEEVAHAVAWLASDASRQVTGAAITVDGGFTVR